jgi:hypothetical protein
MNEMKIDLIPIEALNDSFYGYITRWGSKQRITATNGCACFSIGYRGFKIIVSDCDDDQHHNVYSLVEYTPEINDEALTIYEKDLVTVCRWSLKKGVIDFDHDALTRSRISNSPTLTMFMKMILDSHPDKVPAMKIWDLLRRKSLINTYTLANVLKYYDNIVLIEKLGENLIKNIDQEQCVLNDTSERHKMLGVPKWALTWIDNKIKSDEISSYQAQDMIEHFKIIAENDPNQLKAMFDYLEDYEVVMRKIPANNGHSYWHSNTSGSVTELFGNIAKAKKISNLDARRILNYLIVQNFRQLYNDSNRGDPIRYAITLPSKLASTYCDYLTMAPENPFPQDLLRAHNVAAHEANLAEWSADEKERFAHYGEMLGKKYDMAIDKYYFEVPKNYDEFIKVSKTFMNCLPHCANAFVNGLCNILFIYEDRTKFPRYAIEIGRNNDLIQAKTIHDLDISDVPVLEALDKYLDKIRERA